MRQALLIHNDQMHKIVYVFLTFAFLFIETAGAAYAQSGYERRKFRPFLTRDDTEATISVGVRRNNFNWNIASDLSGTATPNILSELTWEDILLIEFKGKVKHVEPADIYFIHGGVQLEAEVTGGIVASGDNQDSDWFGDNRTLEFSRSNNDASEGYAIGGTVDVGYKFRLIGSSRPTIDINGNVSSHTRVSLAPLIGYGWDRQEYRMVGGVQTIGTLGITPPTGSILSDNGTKYVADWYGPFLGMEATFEGIKDTLRLRGEYHDLTYYGEGFWRGRPTFKQDPSFTQEGDGDGYLINAEYAHMIDAHYAFTIDATYQQRSIEGGLDTLFFTDGTIIKTFMPEVNDESQAIHLGLRYKW